MLFAMCIWLLATWAALAEPPVTVEGEVRPDHLPFHHVARYEIRVDAPAGTVIEIAPWAASMPGLEIGRKPPSTAPTTSGRQRLTQDFLLIPSTVRNYELPKIIVLVDGEAQAELPPQPLEIRDLTPEELSVARQLLPIMTLAEARTRAGGGAMPYLLSAGLLLALLGAGSWFWKMRAESNRIFLPWEIAEMDLAKLAALLDKRKISGEQFYVVLSNILRDYVAARFHVPIRERSTPEIAQYILDEAVMETVQSETLVALLRTVDCVKFAQRRPSISQMLEEAAQVREFVVATVPADTSATPDAVPEGMVA
ncbi:MAG: hypothetical protein L3K26_09035 [Candidatus Hydrogenedentes bacterium]|nr:hypothetical protein [Candidatus Hydrogenedentota bacterium]